jgi:membrane-associated phospholipid phosphatase
MKEIIINLLMINPSKLVNIVIITLLIHFIAANIIFAKGHGVNRVIGKNENSIDINKLSDSILYSINKTIKLDIDSISKTDKNFSIIQLNTPYKEHFSNSRPDSLNNMYVLKWYSMFTNLPGDMVSFYHEDITTPKIPLYFGIAALTAGLIATDNLSWRASDKFYRKSGFNKTASDIFVEVGDGRSQFGLAAAFALAGFVANDNRALRTASQVVEAVLASGAVVQVLKHITGRESPFVSTKSGGRWRFFPNQIQYHKHVPAYDAYPSGHLTTSLAAFTVIAENYPEVKWIKPVSYSLEALLAVSMVNTGIHWYSDYPLAVFLGYEFGKIVSHPSKLNMNKNNIDTKTHLTFTPYFNYSGNGFSISFVF